MERFVKSIEKRPMETIPTHALSIIISSLRGLDTFSAAHVSRRWRQASIICARGGSRILLDLIDSNLPFACVVLAREEALLGPEAIPIRNGMTIRITNTERSDPVLLDGVARPAISVDTIMNMLWVRPWAHILCECHLIGFGYTDVIDILFDNPKWGAIAMENDCIDFARELEVKPVDGPSKAENIADMLAYCITTRPSVLRTILRLYPGITRSIINMTVQRLRAELDAATLINMYGLDIEIAGCEEDMISLICYIYSKGWFPLMETLIDQVSRTWTPLRFSTAMIESRTLHLEARSPSDLNGFTDRTDCTLIRLFTGMAADFPGCLKPYSLPKYLVEFAMTNYHWLAVHMLEHTKLHPYDAAVAIACLQSGGFERQAKALAMLVDLD